MSESKHAEMFSELSRGVIGAGVGLARELAGTFSSLDVGKAYLATGVLLAGQVTDREGVVGLLREMADVIEAGGSAPVLN